MYYLRGGNMLVVLKVLVVTPHNKWSSIHTRIHKDHPIDHVIGDVQSSVQTRRMTTSYSELGFLSAIYEGKTHQDLHTCLFACFLSQEEPKRVSKALSDPAWVEAMQEELLQFKLQNVWVLVDLPKGHRAIGTKWSQKQERWRGELFQEQSKTLLPTDIHKKKVSTTQCEVCLTSQLFMEKPFVKDCNADEVDEASL
ncbi:hypothetical protein Tco_0882261 [Tanacetum coccineum]